MAGSSANRNQAGTALLCVLMVTMMLGTLSAALVLVVMGNSLASANQGSGQQALYAADAALEEAISELRGMDWLTLPSGSVSAQLADGSQMPNAPGGRVLDLARLAAERQADSDGIFAAAADRPVWHLFGHAPFANLTPGGTVVPPAYLLVWVADEGDETDGDPERDSNLLLLVRAEAFGASGAHRSVEATVALQTGTGAALPGPVPGDPAPVRREVRVLSWREMP
jgi:type II secretory pathway pseudopilin PulG